MTKTLKKKQPKTNRSFRLSDIALRLTEEIAKQKGISQAAVIEEAIREKAKREHIKMEPPKNTE